MGNSESDIIGTVDDPLVEARQLAEGASKAGVPLRLLGGLAVRVLCPDFPPRLRRDQDIDFGCLSKGRQNVMAYLGEAGCQPDRRFNSLNGDRQMYFNAPSGRPIDVMVDRLSMCHELDFRPNFKALPFTLDVVDLLLTKLQIVELNEKDVRDVLQLLSAFPVAGDSPGEGGPEIDRERFCKIIGADWGWWRTVTSNLNKLPLLVGEHPDLLPAMPPHDPLRNAERLVDLADATPKSMQWKIRAKVGDRMRWYELPEEVAHL
ncbi:MAG: hypothetical protein ABSA65_16245 [Acidimicrobiales bacterium]|jgi:hypothetical protein